MGDYTWEDGYDDGYAFLVSQSDYPDYMNGYADGVADREMDDESEDDESEDDESEDDESETDCF